MQRRKGQSNNMDILCEWSLVGQRIAEGDAKVLGYVAAARRLVLLQDFEGKLLSGTKWSLFLVQRLEYRLSSPSSHSIDNKTLQQIYLTQVSMVRSSPVSGSYLISSEVQKPRPKTKPPSTCPRSMSGLSALPTSSMRSTRLRDRSQLCCLLKRGSRLGWP